MSSKPEVPPSATRLPKIGCGRVCVAIAFGLFVLNQQHWKTNMTRFAEMDDEIRQLNSKCFRLHSQLTKLSSVN